MQLLDDVRYAIRQFVHAPGFSATAVLTLSLGIGATTAIFTLVHAVLLRSLPVVKPSELVRVGDHEDCCVNGGLHENWSLFSYENYKKFRDETRGFSELAAFQAGRTLMGVRRAATSQPAESLRSQYVSGNYFSMFGLRAYAGRAFTQDDDRKGAEPVVMMSYATWQQKYGGDPSVVGSSFIFNGQPFTVIGIAPPGFYGDRMEGAPAFWLPINAEAQIEGSTNLIQFGGAAWLDVLGRLAPGADTKAIEAQMQVELKQFLMTPESQLDAADRTLIPKQTLHLAPGGAGVQNMRDEYESGLHLLMWISGFVLLIACANVANLMLVRATSRRQHTAVQTALGAPRSRQITQVLTESTVLSLFGGIVGVGVAFACTRLILHLAFPEREIAISATPSLPVLAFTFFVSLLTGIVFGVAPAWMTAHADPADALRGAHRATAQASGWTQKSLVIIQTALSVVLLCAAGLLTETLRNQQHQDFGFDVRNRYLLQIDPSMAGYKAEQLPAFYRQLHENFMAIPGVKLVSFALYTPMQGDNWGETVYIDGQAPPPPGSNQNESSWLRVGEGYFDGIGTKIIRGRAINAQDTATTRNVAVVNQTFAKKFFGNEDPIGKHFGDLEAKYAGAYEIVGVTEDTQYWSPTHRIRPTFFLADTQRMVYEDPRERAFEESNHFLNSAVLVTEGNIPGLEPQVRRALASVNPDLAIVDFRSFAAQVDGNFTQNVMLARLTSLFGFLALVLASIGLYGVTAYSVERRTSEIGIRMALGADRLNVLKLVVRGAFAQTCIGLLIGIPASILAGYGMSAKLFGVKPYAPNILLLTIGVLSVAAAIATLMPARKAAILEPIRALRTE
ncbi:MAG TPA: ABC transporter permease [Terriglobales bacterium]|nr:ABC transporter permease [Terriglobales bacterium]